MATQADAAAQLNAVNDKLTKVGTETSALLDEVQKLKDAAANSDQVSPELQAAIDAVSAQADKVDNLVPDVPAPGV